MPNGHGLRFQQEFAKTMLDVMDDDEAEKKELLHQFITELVMHEMGHTMGLMHNSHESIAYAESRAAKRQKVTGKYGVIGSVMDYSTVNLSLDRSKTGPLLYHCHRSLWPLGYRIWLHTFSPGEEKRNWTK